MLASCSFFSVQDLQTAEHPKKAALQKESIWQIEPKIKSEKRESSRSILSLSYYEFGITFTKQGPADQLLLRNVNLH